MERYLHLKNSWWDGKLPDAGFTRPAYLDKLTRNIDQKLIQILTGLRRVGKSTLALQLINYLIAHKSIDPRSILFFSIEEPSLNDYSIAEIINQYRSIHKFSTHTKIYVFIDEIQFRDGWEQEIKSLYDTEDIKFILTGSSAMLLSEKLSYLTGRYLSTQIHPLSFQEYLDFTKFIHSKVDEFLLVPQLESYLETGGMPEHVINRPDRYLQTTVESILFKDLVSKFQLRNPKLLTDILLLLADRVGSVTSSLKMSRILELGKDTVITYIDYLQKTFLVETLSLYSTSRNQEIYNPTKHYFTDLGIASTYSSKKNFGALAENATFNAIKQIASTKLRSKFGYWYEDGNEVDFVYSDGSTTRLIESKWIDDVKSLETKSMTRAAKKLNLQSVLVVTRSLDTQLIEENISIICIPLYKFLLETDSFL